MRMLYQVHFRSHKNATDLRYIRHILLKKRLNLKKNILDIGSKSMVAKGERGWKRDKLRVWN